MHQNITLSAAAEIIHHSTTVFWFRRDLRLEDNAGLLTALRDSTRVVPLFIFDRNILGNLEERKDLRVDFIHQALEKLKTDLEAIGSSLVVVHGTPEEVFRHLTPQRVYASADYEPYARARDAKVENMLTKKGSTLCLTKDHVIFEKDEVTKSDGNPYTIFTPYSRAWKKKLADVTVAPQPTRKYFHHLEKIRPLPLPTLGELGFETTGMVFPKRVIRRSVIKDYQAQRNFPAREGTSRLGVHLRFGTVSIRQLVQVALQLDEAWLNELIWREFYQMILWFFPHVEHSAFKPAYDHIVWRNNEDEFAAWCNGTTGYPLVDAGMRQLNGTGWMHNRVRMVTASFLTKHLLIDYRWGEAYFAARLIDYELASNNGGWQWAAGSGCDAAPYFRVFNPALQQKRFDPGNEYVKRWVPEFGTPQYPAPIVDHAAARARALAVYAAGLAAGKRQDQS